MISALKPLNSLRNGCWFKLICGASYHHLPTIQHLAAAYTIAGVDCIDVAADPAIVAAAADGIDGAMAGSTRFGPGQRPWLMVSVNDGEDPHFRKATFDATACPPSCSQPCVSVCPADAIAFSPEPTVPDGIIDSRCYGCGRCLPVCPIDHIQTRSYEFSPAAIAAGLFPQVDAVEIHTQIGRLSAFQHLWQAIQPWLSHLHALSISCPDGDGNLDYLWQVYEVIRSAQLPIIWQTDGRPMSGDIGKGTTQAAIRYAQKVLSAGPPGFIQLAGGTNAHTVPRLRELGLLRDNSSQSRWVAGVAYGSYARKLITPWLDAATVYADLEPFDKSGPIPSCSSIGDPSRTRALPPEAMTLANRLVNQLKSTSQTAMAENA